jgi:ABC-type branched-subunit amino acid transport system substrate-binding protein
MHQAVTAIPVVPYAGWVAKPTPASDPLFSASASAAIALALLALCASGGCPGRAGPDFGKLPTITSADPRAEAELAQARALDDHGDRSAAALRYRAFIAKRPKDPLTPVASLALGRILLAQGHPSEAKPLLDRVADHPDAALSEQGRFYGAIARHRLGDDEQAVKTLQPMVGRPVDPADTSLLLRTLAEALMKLARYGEAIATLDTLAADTIPEADRRWASEQLTELTRDKASAQDIERLYRDLPRDGAAWRQVVKRAVRDADAAGDAARAHELLEIMREREIPLDVELSAIAVRAERPAEANPQVIGAVLSLSGRGRKVGELALRGLMLAAGLPLQGPPSADAPQLVFRDDGGEPERAAEAVTELVSLHRAIAIIGPMDVRASEAAAARAQELGVPMVLLSPGGKALDERPMVYRFFATPDDELRALLARLAATSRSHVAALLPQGPYGDLMEAMLRAQATASGSGVELRAVRRYSAGATNFGEHTEALAKLAIDAVMLADDPREVALIAPALAAAGLWCTPAGEQPPSGARAISVVAPSVAYDQDLARSVGRYLQGALFSVPFDPKIVSGSAQRFAEQFQAQFSEPPDAFAAFAHDAYALVRKAVDSGAKTRAAVATALSHVQSTELAGPSSGMGADHKPRHPTRLLELRGEAFVPLEQANK